MNEMSNSSEAGNPSSPNFNASFSHLSAPVIHPSTIKVNEMANSSEAEKSNPLPPNLAQQPPFNANFAQPSAPVIYPPTASSGYPQPGFYSPSQGGYPLPEPVINASAPGTVYTPIGPNYYPPGTQPPTAALNWMPVPVGVPVCPPGLEYLTVIDQLIINQKTEMMEVMLRFETPNEFLIKNSSGQIIYTAKEETDLMTRNFMGAAGSFDMRIKDYAGKEVIHLISSLKSLCCCLKIMEVMSPPGMLIGSIVQEFSWSPHLNVMDVSGEVVLIIKGPLITSSFGDVNFRVLSKDGSMQVGCIKKQWSGFRQEAFTDADNFVVTFPMDLDVNMKAVLLGACMLIDLLYYENRGNGQGAGNL